MLNKIHFHVIIHLERLVDDMTTQELMGLRIKKLREEKKMSQSTLAELVGYKDKTAIAKVEAGKVDLPQSKISAFAKSLNTTTAYLFNDNNTDEKLDYNESYYFNEDANKAAQFLFENPDYKVLFDASRKVKKEDIDLVAEMIKRMAGSSSDDTGC